MTRTIYTLANLAEVSGPDSGHSPGAQFLRQVEDAFDESSFSDTGSLSPDDVHELADACVPIYMHHRMRTLVDLAAYGEDISDLAPEGADIVDAAGFALYLVAERLLFALAAEAGDPEAD